MIASRTLQNSFRFNWEGGDLSHPQVFKALGNP